MANDIAGAGTRQIPVVEITSGKLQGASAAGVYAFKGVPYGASAAGRNRFMAPQPPQPWSGVRDALAYAGHALAARISATWIAFARNRTPDNSAIPPWPPYTTQERATMILDTACRVVHDPNREMRLLWSRVAASTAPAG
jgi:carboxylesterase type B